MTAMTAMTLDQLSGGRFILGLGTSGPQVVEGWHGVPYGKPLDADARVRRDRAQDPARARAARAHGRALPDPVPRPGRDRARQAAEEHPPRCARDIPIYIAAIGPKSVELRGRDRRRLAAVFFSPTAARARRLDEGFARAGAQVAGLRHRADRCTSSSATTSTACRDADQADARALHRRHGRARQELLQRPRLPLGYEDAAKKIQDLYLGGKKREAIAAVPDAAGRRGGAGRSDGAHPRPARGVAGVGRDDLARRDARRRGLAHARGARALASARGGL